jgi:hypothetical protein
MAAVRDPVGERAQNVLFAVRRKQATRYSVAGDDQDVSHRQVELGGVFFEP